jgi:AcrR family transcriptional regulator
LHGDLYGTFAQGDASAFHWQWVVLVILISMTESHRPEVRPDAAEPPTRPPLAAMRSDTLARVEKAVLELFSSRDFHEVSLHDVARSANVSLQTIYKYFGSKEALVYSMLDIMLGRLAERMIDHLQGIDDARERLRKTCWVTLDYMDRHPAVMLLMFTAVPVSRHKNIGIYESPELMGAFLGVFKDGQARGVLNGRVSSKVLLDVFMGIVGRVVLMHIVRGEKRPLTDQFDELFHILWRAMSAD